MAELHMCRLMEHHCLKFIFIQDLDEPETDEEGTSEGAST
jgi:hypothetical protein